jgi:hypothetical protein
MFLRLLFVFLIALNIAVGAWLLLGQNDALGRSATDPGIPILHLLSEDPPAAPTPAFVATVAAPSASSQVPATSSPALAGAAALSPSNDNPNYACMALGPFATPSDLQNARDALANQVQRTRARQEQTMQSRGWWVHLPPTANHAAALAQSRLLGAHNVQDYFVISSGDDQNTISLGLFKDPANARKRRDEVVAAGFPAQMSERTEQVPEYWLDLVPANTAHFEWRSHIRDPAVGSHSTGCF